MRFIKSLALWVIVASLLLCGCTQEAIPPTETTAAPETTVAPTTEPPMTAAAESAVVLHSGIREDGSFDEGTLFIGDSLTNGLLYVHLYSNSLLGDARYMSIVGATPQAFFNGPAMTKDITGAYSGQFSGMIFSKAVASVGDSVTAVYFMMGTNYSTLTNASTYIEIVDYLLENCPNATIYLQTIPYSESAQVHYDEINWCILEAYGTYAMDGNPRVQLIDTKHAIGVALSSDGIHLNAEGYKYWYEELVAYAEENEIPQ